MPITIKTCKFVKNGLKVRKIINIIGVLDKSFFGKEYSNILPYINKEVNGLSISHGYDKYTYLRRNSVWSEEDIQKIKNELKRIGARAHKLRLNETWQGEEDIII